MPSRPANTALPGELALRSPRKSAEGFATSVRPVPRHFEDADLVSRAETVLHGAQHAEVMAALAFEIEDRVEQMLERFRTRDLTFFRDVVFDEQHRSA